jgi:hypothetical protein
MATVPIIVQSFDLAPESPIDAIVPAPSQHPEEEESWEAPRRNLALGIQNLRQRLARYPAPVPYAPPNFQELVRAERLVSRSPGVDGTESHLTGKPMSLLLCDSLARRRCKHRLPHPDSRNVGKSIHRCSGRVGQVDFLASIGSELPQHKQCPA